MADDELTIPEFDRFRALIYEVAGIRIPPTKIVMVSNRLRRRLKATGIASFSAYLTELTGSARSTEMPAFLDAITTNETYFYRDVPHYDWLGDTFLPGFATGSPKRAPRIWSAACATGEEPYSIALKVAAHRPASAARTATILGTDLSNAALDAARSGHYDERAIHLIPPAERERYFDPDPTNRRWTLRPEVRSLVTWRWHNLLEPLKVEPFDCIFIKNVLIYFDAESKQTVVRNLMASLAKGGYLVVGPTEGIFGMLGALTKHKTWLYQNPS